MREQLKEYQMHKKRKKYQKTIFIIFEICTAE